MAVLAHASRRQAVLFFSLWPCRNSLQFKGASTMRNGTLFRLGVSFAGFVLLGAAIASPQSTQKPQSPNNTISPMAQGLAAQMVPAQAVLDKELDSRKAQPGQEFR